MNSIRRYLSFVKPYRKQISWTIVIGLLKFGIPLLIPLILKYVVDNIISASGISETDKLIRLGWLLGGAVFVFGIIRPPIEYYRQYYAQWVASKVLFDIRDKLFHHIQRLSLRFYSNNKSGEIISRVINDVEQTKDFVITGLMNVWLDMFTIVIAIIIMATMDGWLTLAALAMLPFYGGSVKYFYARLRGLTKERSQALAEVQGHLHERVQGMSVIRSFALEDYEQQRFNKRNGRFLEKAMAQTSWNAKTFAVVNTITDLAPLLVIGISAYRAILGHITIGEVVAFAGYMDRLYNPLRRLVNSSTTLTQAHASMDRVVEFMDEEYDIKDGKHAESLDHVDGAISFEHVSFRYNDHEPDVLTDINLSVEKGETIALVGMSGGGKSSLVSLIPRFYDVTGGRILLDGADIRSYKVRTLRDKIGMVLQDNILFSESVKENILMGNPEASDEEVVSAAKAANAHDFILGLPQGYDTKIGERGVKLSGGQKQRLAIARVFLKNPPLLILDEATSALDLESEHLIQESLETLAKDRTTFIVAHRLATITHADRIVVIIDGQIAESGTHSALMRQEGAYYNLFNVQAFD
ncbi:ABC transporter ATP-binding protein [Fictibacillus macauensis ZFHKF-1]|uniref:ABC transporter ATP-binding protein n=1 Tax=Fictibacillus macauensis ZFHKF-1 TaxID=1196324 RepID=I8UCZ1_9BACL|nr:ABC transporter ATP-binding protein [Fictibacillus macauensis]EIT84663.1 ABC transporter ATP-binding protein [Fictibacillus macauensis ZFHKF-1]